MSQLSDKCPSQQLGSSSGSNMLCSMETVDVPDTFCSEDEDRSSQVEGPWGRLFPIGNHLKTLDLCKLSYTFGRGDNCDYSLNIPELRAYDSFLTYSKVHFKITRETTSTGCHTLLEDLSSNGTFINGTKVGKNKRQVLKNNDEISLSFKRNKAFVYMDASVQEDMQFPEELRARYTISKVLGRGACGEVRLAFEKGTCRKFAIKVISKKTFSIGGKTQMNLSSQVMNEVKVLKALQHPCIIQVEDVIDTKDTLFIILELVEGGELFDRVASLGQLDEATAKLIFYQLVVAIKYLHEQGITHRDLKPENVLLMTDDKETMIKVTDFGLSKFVDANTMMKTFCGTPNYLAPEVLKTAGTQSYTQAIDCWSMGVILFICLSGYPPFSDEYKDMVLAQQIIKGHYKFIKEYWKDISSEAIDMVKQFLTVDPQKRLSLAEALKHPWLTDNKMLAKANKLMYPDAVNGGSCHLTATTNSSLINPVTREQQDFHKIPEVAIPCVRSSRPELKKQREESSETVDADDGEGSRDSAEIMVHPVEPRSVKDNKIPSLGSLRSEFKRQWDDLLDVADEQTDYDDNNTKNVSNKKLASEKLPFQKMTGH